MSATNECDTYIKDTQISADFTDEKTYKTQNAQEIFTQHILTDSFQMNIIVAGTPRQIYGKNTAEIIIFTRSSKVEKLSELCQSRFVPLLIVGGTVIRQHNLKGCLGGNASQKPIKSTPDTVRYGNTINQFELTRI